VTGHENVGKLSPFGFLAPEDSFITIDYKAFQSFFLYEHIPITGNGYSRNAPCELDLISIFYFKIS
jgi:hypothetical protein